MIAILAAISIVAYNGIRQRAANASTIASANQVLKAIASYGATTTAYPVDVDVVGCLVPSESGSCTVGNTTARPVNATFNANIATVAGLPSSVPDAYNVYNGIAFWHNSATTFNGEPRPLRLYYSLRGNQQQCGVPNVSINSNGDDDVRLSSSTGYTSSGGGYTVCTISVPRP